MKINLYKKLTPFLVLFCMNLAFPALSQPVPGYEVSGRLNFTNFQFPIDRQIQRNDFRLRGEIEYFRHFRGGIGLGIPLKFGFVDMPTDELGNSREMIMLSADVLVKTRFVKDTAFLNPYLIAGVGAAYEDLKDFDFVLPLGGGLNIRLSEGLFLTTKAEYRLSRNNLKDNVQLGLGLTFYGKDEKKEELIVAMAEVESDRDGDGLPDDVDLCPDLVGPIIFNGCPDSDGDGTVDSEDQCPAAAGLPENGGCPDRDGDGVIDREDGCPDQYGLPELRGCPLIDKDGDGLPDRQDDCPDLAGPILYYGCPDTDGDGISDREDQCPQIAGPATGMGCPDADTDGIIDSLDRCPNSAGPVSNDGCPELREEDKEVLSFATRAVKFETGSARLKNESYRVLNQIVEIMERFPDYNLMISGHTDAVGSDELNQRLSERRAKACFDYIMSLGFDIDRVDYRGYGESRPIADNRFEAGRERNRRVEFDIYLAERPTED